VTFVSSRVQGAVRGLERADSGSWNGESVARSHTKCDWKSRPDTDENGPDRARRSRCRGDQGPPVHAPSGSDRVAIHLTDAVERAVNDPLSCFSRPGNVQFIFRIRTSKIMIFRGYAKISCIFLLAFLLFRESRNAEGYEMLLDGLVGLEFTVDASDSKDEVVERCDRSEQHLDVVFL